MIFEDVLSCPICMEKNNICDFIKESNIKECKNCGYVFDSPRPTTKSIAQLYSMETKYNLWFDPDRYTYLMRSNLKRLKIISKFTQKKNLLDIGGGCGFLLYLATHHGFYNEVMGTEISTSAIEIAKKEFNINLTHGMIEKINIEHKFDNISIIHVLEHVPDPRKTILAADKFLNNDGYLIIAVPNDIDRITNLRRKLKNKPIIPKITLHVDSQIHLSHFRVKTLKFLLASCGYETIYEGLDPVGISNKGIVGIVWKAYYLFSKFILFITNKNIYTTMLIISKKKR